MQKLGGGGGQKICYLDWYDREKTGLAWRFHRSCCGFQSHFEQLSTLFHGAVQDRANSDLLEVWDGVQYNSLEKLIVTEFAASTESHPGQAESSRLLSFWLSVWRTFGEFGNQLSDYQVLADLLDAVRCQNAFGATDDGHRPVVIGVTYGSQSRLELGTRKSSVIAENTARPRCSHLLRVWTMLRRLVQFCVVIYLRSVTRNNLKCTKGILISTDFSRNFLQTLVSLKWTLTPPPIPASHPSPWPRTLTRNPSTSTNPITGWPWNTEVTRSLGRAVYVMRRNRWSSFSFSPQKQETLRAVRGCSFGDDFLKAIAFWFWKALVSSLVWSQNCVTPG